MKSWSVPLSWSGIVKRCEKSLSTLSTISRLYVTWGSLSCNIFPYDMKYTGWWFQPLWKIWVNWDDKIPNIWKYKSHPPTSIIFPYFIIILPLVIIPYDPHVILKRPGHLRPPRAPWRHAMATRKRPGHFSWGKMARENDDDPARIGRFHEVPWGSMRVPRFQTLFITCL